MAEGQQEYKLTYRCGPVTRAFHADITSRVKLLIGPFGTGKTSAAAYDQINLQSRRVRPDRDGIKRSRFAVIRNTYPQLRDTVIKTVLDWWPPSVFGDFLITGREYRLYLSDHDGGRREVELLFRALDLERDVRNLLSLELTGAWVDEAREVRHDIIKGLLGRVGRYPSVRECEGQNPFLTPPQVLLTTNYPSREHWLYGDFVKAPIDGYTIYEQTQAENLHNLRPGYYADLEQDYAHRPDLLNTLVRGVWGVTIRGKQVYPEWSTPFHAADQPLLPAVRRGMGANNLIIRGWDNTGLSPACIVTFLNSIGQWLVFREFCGADVGIVDFGEWVQSWCGEYLPGAKYQDYGDPAGKTRDTLKKSPAQYLYEHLMIRVRDGIQTFKTRRESVAGRLTRAIQGEPAILVDPGCIRLIDGFEGGYAYREIGNTGHFSTDPDKNEYSHIHDALQYPATRLFGPPRTDHVMTNQRARELYERYAPPMV